MSTPAGDTRDESIGIIGAGCAGLITAHILSKDGFRKITILTRDSTVGGVWSPERVYPDLKINNVHGEYRFSDLEMKIAHPSTSLLTTQRLTGDDMSHYMQEFSGLVQADIRFRVEVLSMRRDASRSPQRGWVVRTRNLVNNDEKEMVFDRIVLCTGGCSSPIIPPSLSPKAAKAAGFTGPVFHSNSFSQRLDGLLDSIPAQDPEQDPVIIVGGGKSAQDIASYLARAHRRVTVVFEKADAILAAKRPLPEFIRKSRFLAVFSPYSVLRTRLERFLHTTWLGSKIVHFVWSAITSTSFGALSIPKTSPLRDSHSLFWGIRTNDEGAPRAGSFHALVNAGQINLVSPIKVERYSNDGKGVMLRDGTTLKASAVVLATGYGSSWEQLFDKRTAEEVGISRVPPVDILDIDEWRYKSMAHPPPAHPHSDQWSSLIYRGIVPAKSILNRDLAINGAVFTTNVGYTCEVTANWISSYFLSDTFLRLPSTVEEAVAVAERNARWMRLRYPDQLLWANESYSADVCFWTWPQYCDQLMEDLGLRSMRSGGNWLTWPFKIVDLNEIKSLSAERAILRERAKS